MIANKLNNPDFDIDSEEMEQLIEWTENLSFDSYVKDWYQLSTSQSSNNFVPKFVNAAEYNVLL